jgi:uncharacterized protein YjbJ (UPF0337 family)
MQKDRAHIDKPPKRGMKDASGKATDNPKLPKQAEGAGSQPSGTGKAKARDALKH